MSLLSEIKNINKYMKLLNEQSSEKKIYYNKCEGGMGEIDPQSYEFIGKDNDGNEIIRFIKEPDVNYNNGDSSSIGGCLGAYIPLTGRCFNILDNAATYEMDCETKKSKY